MRRLDEKNVCHRHWLAGLPRNPRSRRNSPSQFRVLDINSHRTSRYLDSAVPKPKSFIPKQGPGTVFGNEYVSSANKVRIAPAQVNHARKSTNDTHINGMVGRHAGGRTPQRTERNRRRLPAQLRLPGAHLCRHRDPREFRGVASGIIRLAIKNCGCHFAMAVELTSNHTEGVGQRSQIHR